VPLNANGRVVLSVLFVLSAVFAGCGGDGIDRVEVFGNVTLDGKPLDDAAILFVPLGDGPTAGTQFTGGEYRIEEARGPSPGKYRVEITAYRGTGEMIEDSDLPGQMEERRESVVPERYNSQSQLTVELTPGNANRHDFALQSQ